MNSICRFIPVKNSNGNLKTVHFVYETEWKRLKQPFLQPIYYVFLVTRGNGKLHLLEFGEHTLTVGSLFFIFPGIRYEISGSDDLTYMYISFMGSRAPELMESLSVTMQAPLYNGFDGQIPFWREALQRLNLQNANLITEGVLLLTLSHLSTDETRSMNWQKNDILQNITDYVDNNFADPGLNLKKVAAIFGYTDKYLSHLFKQGMNINFTTYLNRLRIQHAIELIENGLYNSSELTTACGFYDSMYFSRVFKKVTGQTPITYIKKQTHI